MDSVVCRKCRSDNTHIETRSGQDCVFCDDCGCYSHNAPRTETGRRRRTVSTVHEGITPKKRARIVERATGRCELCGSRSDLHVGHLVSVKHGMQQGLTDAELNSEENLAAMCAECNLGLGDNPVPLRIAIALVMGRCRNQQTAKGKAHGSPRQGGSDGALF